MPSFLFTYVLGGLTFLPLCAAAFLAFVFYISPVVDSGPYRTGIPDLSATSLDDNEPVTIYRAGWLTVRRTYEPAADPSGGTYAGMLTSFLDTRSKDPRRSKPKDRFFGVLKQNILFLYEGEDQAECWAAIEVSAHKVVVYPEGNVDGELWVKRTAIELKPKKGEDDPTSPTGHGSSDATTYDLETGKPLPWYLFVKVNSDKEDWCVGNLMLIHREIADRPFSYRYHSLVLASRLGAPNSAAALAADRALFDPEDMARLVESIDAQPDSIPMRWFNALLGRVFLSTYRTLSRRFPFPNLTPAASFLRTLTTSLSLLHIAVEDYLTSRLVRKLKRVKLPSLLSEVKVKEVNVGPSLPLLSRPMLKDLTADGDASMEVHVGFVGAVRVTIETVATLSLGSRSYSVRLVLAVILRELEGTLLVKMKRPPSNRLWFGFTTPPACKIDIEPVVSTRQIKWSLITGPIEAQIRELVRPLASFHSHPPTLTLTIPSRLQIADSLVLPHMDDIAFFDTRAFSQRGGIYGECLRQQRDLDEQAASGAQEDLVSLPSGGKGGENAADDVVGDIVPSVVGEKDATGGGARQRSAALRRRRSSEGDRPLELTPTNDSTSTTSTSPSSVSRVKGSSSVSSGLAGLSASIASWREQRAAAVGTSFSAASSPGAAPAVLVDDEPKKKHTWFSKPSTLASGSSSTSLSPLPNPSAATPSASSLPVDTPLPLPLKDEAKEEVSARKLKEVLEQRARSRERERTAELLKEKENEIEGAGDEAVEERNPGAASRTPPMPSSTPSPGEVEKEEQILQGRPILRSNLSLTAPPASADVSSQESGTPLVLHDDEQDADTAAHDEQIAQDGFVDSPVPASSAASVASVSSVPSPVESSSSTAPGGPPQLPARPTSIAKSLPDPPPPPPASSVPSSPAPSVPAPAHRRPGHTSTASDASSLLSSASHPSHASSSPTIPSSPSFHSSSATASSSSAGLLASWRVKAAPLSAKEGREKAAEEAKEAVLKGVQEAKERFLGSKWGERWGGVKKTAVEGIGENNTPYFAPPSPDSSTPVQGRSFTPKTPERPSSSSVASTSSAANSVRSHRSSSLSLSSSPSGGGLALFSPPVEARVSAVTAGVGGGVGGGGGAYQRAPSMTLPGIRDQRLREKVKQDHLGAVADPTLSLSAPSAPSAQPSPSLTSPTAESNGSTSGVETLPNPPPSLDPPPRPSPASSTNPIAMPQTPMSTGKLGEAKDEHAEPATELWAS